MRRPKVNADAIPIASTRPSNSPARMGATRPASRESGAQASYARLVLLPIYRPTVRGIKNARHSFTIVPPSLSDGGTDERLFLKRFWFLLARQKGLACRGETRPGGRKETTKDETDKASQKKAIHRQGGVPTTGKTPAAAQQTNQRRRTTNSLNPVSKSISRPNTHSSSNTSKISAVVRITLP